MLAAAACGADADRPLAPPGTGPAGGGGTSPPGARDGGADDGGPAVRSIAGRVCPQPSVLTPPPTCAAPASSRLTARLLPDGPEVAVAADGRFTLDAGSTSSAIAVRDLDGIYLRALLPIEPSEGDPIETRVPLLTAAYVAELEAANGLLREPETGLVILLARSPLGLPLANVQLVAASQADLLPLYDRGDPLTLDPTAPTGAAGVIAIFGAGPTPALTLGLEGSSGAVRVDAAAPVDADTATFVVVTL